MARPLIIAHRGASGYLPEHTLEAASYAHALGADFVEQDVVMSRDDVLIVLHDIHLDATTDVAARHPQRARTDGRFYAIDFTWSELRALQVRERFDPRTGRPVFPARFPANGAAFRLCTLEEQLQLLQGLNQSTGRATGVYPEIKAPAWHAQEGKDPGRALVALLERYGYRRADQPAIIQCFDPEELQRLRPLTQLRFVLLLEPRGAPAYPPEPHLTPAGLRRVATYAQGIGPHLSLLGPLRSADDAEIGLSAAARAAGLFVHPYTLRADQLPPEYPDLGAWVDALAEAGGVEGVFTDHPDRARRHDGT